MLKTKRTQRVLIPVLDRSALDLYVYIMTSSLECTCNFWMNDCVFSWAFSLFSFILSNFDVLMFCSLLLCFILYTFYYYSLEVCLCLNKKYKRNGFRWEGRCRGLLRNRAKGKHNRDILCVKKNLTSVRGKDKTSKWITTTK